MSGTNNNPGNLHNTNPPLNYLQPPNNNPMTGLPVTNAPIPGVNTASPYSTVSMQSPYTQGSIPTSGVTPQPPINTNALLAILGQLNSLAPKQPDIPMDPNQMGNLFNMYPQFPYMPPNLGTYNPPMNPYEPKVKESYRPTRRSDAIIVCNLPPDITVDKLAEEFEKYGKLKVCLLGTKKLKTYNEKSMIVVKLLINLSLYYTMTAIVLRGKPKLSLRSQMWQSRL